MRERERDEGELEIEEGKRESYARESSRGRER